MFRLKELRLAKNIPQKELALHMGVTQTAVSDWENENRKPDYDSLLKLADFFGVSVDYLLGREETKKGPPSGEPNKQSDEEDFRYALSGELKDLTDEEFQEIMNYIKFVEQKRRKK